MKSVVVRDAAQLLANAGVIVGNSRLLIAVLVINLSSILVNHSRTSAAESWPWKFPVNLFLSETRKMAISLVGSVGLLNQPLPPVLCSLVRACSPGSSMSQSSPPLCGSRLAMEQKRNLFFFFS